eukprot:COSAG03_NODE_16119_length_411_cov_0.977564_1_plen_38_part_01
MHIVRGWHRPNRGGARLNMRHRVLPLAAGRHLVQQAAE